MVLVGQQKIYPFVSLFDFFLNINIILKFFACLMLVKYNPNVLQRRLFYSTSTGKPT